MINGSSSSVASKDNRVRVGVRCRPAFQDEIDFAKDHFFPIVNSVNNINSPYEQLALTLVNGKQREFSFDYVFASNDTQDYVYDQIARPVVDDVLKGYNGTVFAYGQTGTGKTYTMGILEFINNEHAGIIPRAIFQIFNIPSNNNNNNELVVSLSFLQIYRESIQDLLAPASIGNSSVEDNLLIREDPNRGFYVEGLQEYIVRNYSEAEALINLGLENRAIAPTLMNSTSSRSHTVLTLTVEQRVITELSSHINNKGKNGSHTKPSSSTNTVDQQHYTRTLRSKLLMVDLAGSERVRRTVSKGTRLSEAKSINTSLSALGNVIAALADPNSSHIPYRDSKLTRLLQDSLGGTARTALIATIGPAAMNYGETLSTLLFASRCMAVKIVPMQHAEVDYVEMCAALQAKVNEMDGEMTKKLLQQQDVFETKIKELSKQLKQERNSSIPQDVYLAIQEREVIQEKNNSELRILLDQIEKLREINNDTSEESDASNTPSWLGKPIGWSPNNTSKYDFQQTTLLAYCFKIISQVNRDLKNILETNSQREHQNQQVLQDILMNEDQEENKRKDEKKKLFHEDPRNKLKTHNDDDNDPTATKTTVMIGSHLATLSKPDAIRKVNNQFRSNNDYSLLNEERFTTQVKTKNIDNPLPAIYNYNSIEELLVALTTMNKSICDNLISTAEIMALKDAHFKNIKNELAAQLMEKRKREEEVINWSYILKYLLTSSSKLKKRLQNKEENQDNNSSIIMHNPTSPFIHQEDNLPKQVALPPSISDLNSRFLLSVQQQQKSFKSSQPPYNIPVPKKDNNVTIIVPPSQLNDDVNGNRSNTINVKSTFEKVRANRPIKSHYQNNFDANTYTTPLTESALQHYVSSGSSPLSKHANSVDDSELSVSSTGYSVLSNANNYQQQNIKHTPAYHMLAPPPNKQRNIIALPHSQSTLQYVNTRTTSDEYSGGGGHSRFAKTVVEELGVNKKEASAAMSVIDKVSKITEEQLSMLDPVTRQQIFQIRADLGINNTNLKVFTNSNQTVVAPTITPTQSRRSKSVPRSRDLTVSNETMLLSTTKQMKIKEAQPNHIIRDSQINTSIQSQKLGDSLIIGSNNKYGNAISWNVSNSRHDSHYKTQLQNQYQHQQYDYEEYDEEDEEYSQLDFI